MSTSLNLTPFNEINIKQTVSSLQKLERGANRRVYAFHRMCSDSILLSSWYYAAAQSKMTRDCIHRLMLQISFFIDGSSSSSIALQFNICPCPTTTYSKFKNSAAYSLVWPSVSFFHLLVVFRWSFTFHLGFEQVPGNCHNVYTLYMTYSLELCNLFSNENMITMLSCKYTMRVLFQLQANSMSVSSFSLVTSCRIRSPVVLMWITTFPILRLKSTIIISSPHRRAVAVN